jgi:hypothetical protein
MSDRADVERRYLAAVAAAFAAELRLPAAPAVPPAGEDPAAVVERIEAAWGESAR